MGKDLQSPLLMALGQTSGNPGALGADGSASGLIWEMNALRAENLVDCCTVAPTVTRATTKTRVNSSGLIEVVPINTILRDYDPVTLALKGLLIEGARTNLLLRSAEFNNAAWTVAACTISANATTGPDGTSAMDKVVEDGTNAQRAVYQAASYSTGSYTHSVYAKSAGRDWLRLGNGTNFAWFNLSAGTVGTQTNCTGSIASAGNGIYRCAVTMSLTAGTDNFYCFVANGDGVAAYQGDGSSGLYLWGAQLEAGSFPTSYIPTTTASVTRNADVASLATSLIPGFNAAQGALAAEWIISVFDNCYLAQLDDGTNSNRIWLATNGYQVDAHTVVAGVQQVGSSLASPVDSALHTAVSAWKVNDFAEAFDGSVLADTSGSVPATTALRIGSNGVLPGYEANSPIRKLHLYNRRLSNAELQAMTA